MSRNDRFPFHFNDSELEARRADFLKRFGLRSDEDRSMFYETPSFTSFGSNWPDWQERFRRGGHFDDTDWRNRTWHSQTGSEPGSPRLQHRMRTPGWSSCDADSVPIRVIHENSPDKYGADDASESETSSQGSHCSSGHSGQSQRKVREPRVHHIPIMVEPRDGSVSSGYASDGATEEAKMEHDRNLAGVATQNGASDHMGESSVKQSHSDNQGNGFHSQSSKNEASGMQESETVSHQPRIHQVPVKMQSSHNAAGNQVGSNSTYSEHPKNRFAGQRSPVRSFSDNSVEKGSHNGKNMSKQRSKSSTPEPSQTRKQFGGPHITRIPVNISQDSNRGEHGEAQARDASPPPQPSVSGALAKILAVQKEVASLQKEVEAFSGNANDKYFRFLDEMLTRSMLKLDTIDTEGKDEIRAARKTVVREIESCIAVLESKARRETSEVKPEVVDKVDVDMADSSGEKAIPEEEKSEETPTPAQQIADHVGNGSEMPPPSDENSVEEGAQVNSVENSDQTLSAEPRENDKQDTATEHMDTDPGGRSSEEAAQMEAGHSNDVEATKL